MATVDVTIPTQKQRKEASSLHDEGQEQSKSCCKEGSFPREDEGLIVTLVESGVPRCLISAPVLHALNAFVVPKRDELWWEKDVN